MIRRIVGLVAATAVLALAPGCSDDDGGGGGFQPQTTTLEVKPGTWQASLSAHSASGGLCSTLALAFNSGEPSELPLCGPVTPESLIGNLGAACTSTVAGNTVVLSCSGSVTIAQCTFSYAGTGSGTLSSNRDSFTLSVPLTVNPETPSEDCGQTACNVTVVLNATWIGAEGCGGTLTKIDPAAFLAPLVEGLHEEENR